MYIYILKCGPGLLFLGMSWPSVQVEFDMPALQFHEILERKLSSNIRITRSLSVNSSSELHLSRC
jgi:hypothetical protein